MRKRKRIIQFEICGIVIVFLIMLAVAVHIIKKQSQDIKEQVVKEKIAYKEKPELKVELLTVNEYSRPGIALEKVNGIVIHYTANPGTTAMQNRDYFEGLKDSHLTKASAHFIVSIDGEIVQCIPTAEIAYASNSRNKDTIAIECCHRTKKGDFTEQTYQALIRLVAYLMGRFQLTTDDVIRHYDVTGKNCPKYYVENPEKWEEFKDDVNSFILKNGVQVIDTD